MAKIQMTTPLVEMDGDEMTRILWKMIKDELLTPFIDLKTEYYDLGLEYRNETNDQVTLDSAEATKKYGVAVKCATMYIKIQKLKYPVQAGQSLSLQRRMAQKSARQFTNLMVRELFRVSIIRISLLRVSQGPALIMPWT